MRARSGARSTGWRAKPIARINRADWLILLVYLTVGVLVPVLLDPRRHLLQGLVTGLVMMAFIGYVVVLRRRQVRAERDAADRPSDVVS